MNLHSLISIFLDSSNSFEGMEPGEHVALLTRRHPFIILSKLSFIIVLAFLPFIIGFLFFSLLASHGLVALFLFLASVWYLALWLVTFYILTMYTLDIWIITDRRIIDSSQHGFFSRTVSELHLSRVQDISVKTSGMVETMLHFGDLEVQTAGSENKFHFTQIPYPEKIKDIIMQEVNERGGGEVEDILIPDKFLFRY